MKLSYFALAAASVYATPHHRLNNFDVTNYVPTTSDCYSHPSNACCKSTTDPPTQAYIDHGFCARQAEQKHAKLVEKHEGRSDAKEDAAVEAACDGAIFDFTVINDGSGSVGTVNYDDSCIFIQDFVDSYTISSTGTRVTVTQFSSSSTTYTTFADDAATVETAITTMRNSYMRSGTYIAGSLAEAITQINTYGRTGVLQVVMIITDGKSYDYMMYDSVNQADALLATGAKVYVLGVGSGVDSSQLNEMASDPDSSYVFDLDWDNLDTIKNAIAADICAAAPGGRSLGGPTGPFNPAPLGVSHVAAPAGAKMQDEP